MKTVAILGGRWEVKAKGPIVKAYETTLWTSGLSTTFFLPEDTRTLRSVREA